MSPAQRLGALLVTIAVMLGAGCSAAAHLRLLGAGPRGYWDPARLLGARPFLPRQRLVPLPGQSANAHPTALALRVGALFEREGSSDHFCTASVVASPGRDLLITAAHCLNGGHGGGGYRQDIVFIPDYQDGRAPFGIWTPKRLLVAPQWISASDPALDVGFVVLQPNDGRDIEDVLGANRLGIDPAYQQLVRVTGYPGNGNAPVTCMNWTSMQSATQLRFECGGFTGGTSGSPWVTHFDPRTRTGTIVGVIGGYQQGGDTASVSYSSYLSQAVQRLYQQAAAITP
jgi:V8-like Glu-specific endopeptidase